MTGNNELNNIDDCWLFAGSLDKAGYGRVQSEVIHRLVFKAHNGYLPEQGLELDHLCQVKHCINPEHLEVVTHAENMRRQRDNRTMCRNGHQYDEENTAWYSYKSYRFRRCKACATDNARRRYAESRR